MLEAYPELLRRRDVAEILRVSLLTLKRMRDRGDIKFIRINSRGDTRYYKKDILEFLGE